MLRTVGEFFGETAIGEPVLNDLGYEASCVVGAAICKERRELANRMAVGGWT